MTKGIPGSLLAPSWTFSGACYTLTVDEHQAQIYPLKHSMMPPLYHCYVHIWSKKTDFFVERKLRTAKAECEKKVRAACDSTSQR